MAERPQIGMRCKRVITVKSPSIPKLHSACTVHVRATHLRYPSAISRRTFESVPRKRSEASRGSISPFASIGSSNRALRGSHMCSKDVAMDLDMFDSSTIIKIEKIE